MDQTAAVLRNEIDAGTWRDWLPSERFLCEQWQVSRNTLRAALSQLRQEGSLRSVHGVGTKISRGKARQRRVPASREVALLIPDPLDQVRPAQALWIDELRGMLNERNCRLHVLHGHQYFRNNPGAALRKLTSQNPHGCWVVALSNHAVQRWFEKSALPCIVAGSTYEGVKLPFRDIDHWALCHHAAGALLGRGHRRVALLMQKSKRAGDLRSEEGFMAGVAQSPHPDAKVTLGYHESTVASISRTLRRLLANKPPPTALLVINPFHFLTVVSQLKQMGYQIPGDISVISRDDDTFLTFLVPTPARYVVSSHQFAKSLLRPVLELLKTGGVVRHSSQIMPEFSPGGTLARAKNERTG
ncbi:MAG: LacI family DNA-binding transcriptional regulator [Opitutaceae bacterium]|nr:LacI family DNA-binding transcriptional regulator [Cephaloticoccus sp.]MCP5530445.1 LacI family DNA-binding transcriptional regulator [Opitutaceae bacterium]